mgnify:CR=1 FL=1
MKHAKLPQLTMRALVMPATFNADDGTVEIVWSTGAQVRRFDWMDGPYIEELSLDPSHVRLGRLNNGAPVLKDHNAHSIDSVIGVVDKAWLDGGEGRASIRFDQGADVEKYVSKVKRGTLRNISFGYQVHEYEKIPPTEKGGLPILRAIDWEPFEVSLVAVPADAFAQIRSGDQLHTVLITTRGDAMSEPTENHNPAEEVQTPETPVETRADPAADVVALVQQAIQEERQRSASIRDHVRMAKLDESVAEKLIDSGKPLDECRSEVLRLWSEKVDATATASGRPEGESHQQSRAAELAHGLLKQVSGAK